MENAFKVGMQVSHKGTHHKTRFRILSQQYNIILEENYQRWKTGRHFMHKKPDLWVHILLWLVEGQSRAMGGDVGL